MAGKLGKIAKEASSGSSNTGPDMADLATKIEEMENRLGPKCLPIIANSRWVTDLKPRNLPGSPLPYFLGW